MDLVKHKKNFGQNFLSDGNLLRAIVADAGIAGCDTVVEIGAGTGALTAQLAQAAKAVRAYEIDRDLEPALRKNLEGIENIGLVFGDFLELFGRDAAELPAGYKAAANLPYYITTPVLFALIENENPPESITVMVQSEVADRLTARPGTPEYGALTAAVALYGVAERKRTVKAEMFVPRPKVDSAVVRIDRSDRFEPGLKKLASKVIRAAFAMRRKTLQNNLSAAFGLSKTSAAEIISTAGLPSAVRGEKLSAEKFVELAGLLDSP